MLINHLPQITSHIKQHRRPILIGLGVTLLIAAAIYSQLAPTPTPQTPQLPTAKSTYQALIPGRSTHQQIIAQLGVPTDIYQQDSYTIYMYPSSTSYFQPDLLYLENDTLVLKELFFTPLQYDYPLQQVIDAYGQPEQILYQPASPVDQTVVYPYPQSGTSFFVRQSTNQVYKQQQFSPVTSDTYRQTWAKDFLDIQPTPVPHLHPEGE